MNLFGTIWPDPFVFAAAALAIAGAAACLTAALWSLVPTTRRSARPSSRGRSVNDLLRPASPVGQLPMSK